MNILPTRLRPHDALSKNAIEREMQLIEYVGLGRASSWKESHLDLLLVDFKEDNLKQFLLNKIQFKGLTWTLAHQAGIELNTNLLTCIRSCQ